MGPSVYALELRCNEVVRERLQRAERDHLVSRLKAVRPSLLSALAAWCALIRRPAPLVGRPCPHGPAALT